MNLEPHVNLVNLKEKVLKGEDIPAEEYSKVIADLRENRMAGAASGGTAKPKVTKEQADKALDDLFS